MNKSLACIFLSLIGMAIPPYCSADALPDTTVDGQHWRLEQLSDAGHDDNYEVAARRGEQLLLWDRGKNQQTFAEVASLLVAAPFDQVQPLVLRALQQSGPVKANTGTGQLRDLSSNWSWNWGTVLLSRRPDLRTAIAEHAVPAKLQQALQQGAITPQELDWRMDQARARVDRLQLGFDLPALQTTYAYWDATRDHSDGIAGQYQSSLFVHVQDVSAVFGHPATAVQLRRDDTRPNPNYSLWKALTLQDVNWLGGSVSRTTGISVVPGDVFTALSTALSAVPGKLEIATSPDAWRLPATPSTPPPPIALVSPNRGAPVLKPQLIRWDTLVTDPSQRAVLYPHEMLGLPDGSLLVSAQVSDNRGWAEHVWRLHEINGAWQADGIWQGKQGSRRMMISADGSAVWFDGQPNDESAPCLYRYDVASRKVSRYEMRWPKETDWQKHRVDDLHWILADDLPANFWHDIRLGEKPSNPVGYEYLTVQRPATPPPDADGPWPFRTALSSVRQSLMDDISGNSSARIWPVRWRPSGSYWTEDPQGIAELDANTGRTLRAIALPQRFGRPDPASAAGAAQWVPEPLGSQRGQWIATGFVLTLSADGSIPPAGESAGSDGVRFAGMHVVDLKSGHVLSPLLGRADKLNTAAGSPSGRFLAMGSTYVHAGISTQRVALWDIARGRTPVQLDASPLSNDSEIRALAFSWNGSMLWALGQRELLLWQLPTTLRDRATLGNPPDQSTN